MAVAQLIGAGLVALLVLSLVGVAFIHRTGTRTAIAAARELAVAQARLVVEPTLTDGLVAGDAASFARFDTVVHQRLLGGRLARVKLWTSDGRIVYSDERRLVGQFFPLEPVDRAVLRTGQSHADVSRLAAAENVWERPTAERLLQVYVRVQAPSGVLLLFETYLHLDSELASSVAIAESVAPAVLLGLLLLGLLQLPMAWRLAQRLSRGQREREVLSLRAAQAAEQERRRIARELHDGVVQSLAGVSYSLAAVTERLAPVASPELVEQVRAATTTTRQGVLELRSLISDIHPPALDRIGLPAAIDDLMWPLQSQGIAVRLKVAAEPPASGDTTEAVYRAAQEAVRNVVAHSGATSVGVELVVNRRWVRLRVTDDGVGFDQGQAVPTDRPHLGLRLLQGLAHSLHGRLTVVSAPQIGTTVIFEVPQ